MARTAYTPNSYVGGANAATLYSNIGAIDTTLTITGTNTTWGNLGLNGGFNLAINYGQLTEEKVYVPSGSYNWSSGAVTFTGVSRGVDGTTAGSQFTGYIIVPVLTAVDLQESNNLVSQTLQTVTTVSGQSLISNGTTLTYGISANEVQIQTIMGALL